MHDAYEAIRDCGWAGWLCLLIALPGLAAGVIGLVMLQTKARGSAWVAGVVAAGLGLGALGTGVAGRQLDIARVIAATSSHAIDPSQRDRIRAVGLEEANQCVRIGTISGGLPFALGALAIGVGLATRKRAQG